MSNPPVWKVAMIRGQWSYVVEITPEMWREKRRKIRHLWHRRRRQFRISLHRSIPPKAHNDRAGLSSSRATGDCRQ